MKTIKLLVFLLLIGVSFFCQSALAAKYTFSQTGFSSTGQRDGSYAFDNGSIFGTFEYDPNFNIELDGLLDHLKSFSLTFSGNAFFDSLNTPDSGSIFASGLNFDPNDVTGTFRLISGYAHGLKSNYLTSLGAYQGDVTHDGFVNLNNDQSIINLNYYYFGSNNDEFDFISASTSQPLIVTEIPVQTPLPGALVLFLTGLSALGLTRRRNTNKAVS